MPVYAAGLGLLEPTKGPSLAEPLVAETKLVDTYKIEEKPAQVELCYIICHRIGSISYYVSNECPPSAWKGYILFFGHLNFK